MPMKKSARKSAGTRGKPMKAGVRSPTAHRTLEQAHKQAAGPNKKPAKQASRAAHNKLRAEKKADLTKKHGASKASSMMKGKDMAKMKDGSYRLQSQSKNRAHGKTRGSKPNKGK